MNFQSPLFSLPLHGCKIAANGVVRKYDAGFSAMELNTEAQNVNHIASPDPGWLFEVFCRSSPSGLAHLQEKGTETQPLLNRSSILSLHYNTGFGTFSSNAIWCKSFADLHTEHRMWFQRSSLSFRVPPPQTYLISICLFDRTFQHAINGIVICGFAGNSQLLHPSIMRLGADTLLDVPFT